MESPPNPERLPSALDSDDVAKAVALRRKLLEEAPPTVSPEILDEVVAAVREEHGMPGPAAGARTAEHLRLFLLAYAETGRVNESAHVAGISPNAVNVWRRRLPAFEAAMDHAITVYRESLIREVHRRGVKGVEEPVFFQGEVCGHIRRYSDRLLELELKRHVPEYRDKREIDINVNAGVLVVGGSAPTEKEWLDKFGTRPPEPARVIDVTPEPEPKEEKKKP
jgi:hypothetical protein